VASLWQRVRQARYRWPLRLAALLVLGVMLFLWFTRRPGEQLTVENLAGEPVKALKVTVAGESYTFRDVAAGAVVTTPLAAKEGERFAVEGTLTGGTMVRASGVMGASTHLLVLPGGEVQFRPARKTFPF
jgi:predicted acyltransferase